MKGSGKHSVTSNADLAHLVERDLAKVEVAGSSPVIRSILIGQKCNLCQKALFYKAFSVF